MDEIKSEVQNRNTFGLGLCINLNDKVNEYKFVFVIDKISMISIRRLEQDPNNIYTMLDFQAEKKSDWEWKKMYSILHVEKGKK
jgi:hypothetical protein